MFNKLVDKILDEIIKLDQKVNYDDLTYKYKGPAADARFNEFNNALDLVDKIREGKRSLADAKNDQGKFKLNISGIKKITKKHMPKEKKAHCIILKCDTNLEMVLLHFFDDYSSTVSEAKDEITKGKGLEVLTPKQILQRLPIALAQVKPGNN